MIAEHEPSLAMAEADAPCSAAVRHRFARPNHTGLRCRRPAQPHVAGRIRLSPSRSSRLRVLTTARKPASLRRSHRCPGWHLRCASTADEFHPDDGWRITQRRSVIRGCSRELVTARRRDVDRFEAAGLVPSTEAPSIVPEATSVDGRVLFALTPAEQPWAGWWRGLSSRQQQQELPT